MRQAPESSFGVCAEAVTTFHICSSKIKLFAEAQQIRLTRKTIQLDLIKNSPKLTKEVFKRLVIHLIFFVFFIEFDLDQFSTHLYSLLLELHALLAV